MSLARPTSQALLVVLLASPGRAQTDPPLYRNPSAPIEARIDDLLPRMTTAEKLHQLATMFSNGNVRLGIPHLKSAEALHGVTIRHATSFPQAIALGSTWDPALVERAATVIAKEARAVGVHQVYSPMLGVLIDPRWGRAEESYGEDPYLVSRIGVAFIKGLQGTGDDLYGPDRIIASPKHFVADGEPIGGLNATNIDLSERRLREIFLPPFEAAVREARVGSLMPAHHAVNGVPMHANVALLVGVLRDEWGFDGHTISDNNDIRGLHDERFVAKTWAEAAALSLAAGVDQELSIETPWEGRVYGAQLARAIEAGTVPIALVDAAVRNVLRSKLRLGLFDDGSEVHAWLDYGVSGDEGSGPIDGYPGYKEVPNTEAVRGIDEPLNEYFNKLHRLGVPRPGWEDVLYDPAHDRLALEAARKAIILLKNEGNLLPVDASKTKRIAVIGPNADAEVLGGYATPEAHHFVTVLDGIRARVDAATEVSYVEGCSLTEYVDGKLLYTRQNIDEAVAAARTADVVVLVLGGNELTAKEKEDTDDIFLAGHQRELARAVHATGTPVVGVLLHGRPLAIPFLAAAVPAILDGWFLGQETGSAVAEALFGDINPGGRLSVSIPRNVGQIPVQYRYEPGTDSQYRDSEAGPLFPFGHGLSYTRFEYANLRIDDSIPDGLARVSIDVTNSGERRGDEVVQLYVHDRYASLQRPVLELKRLERITLGPDVTETVKFDLDRAALSYYHPDRGGWFLEAGDFDILVGSSSADIRARGALRIDVSDEGAYR